VADCFQVRFNTRYLWTGLEVSCQHPDWIVYILFINWFTKCHKVITSEVLFLPRDGWNHLWYSLHLPRKDGQAEWAWVAWINTGMIDPPKVVTNPSTNQDRRSVTSLMWQMPLPLRQTSHIGFKSMDWTWLAQYKQTHVQLCSQPATQQSGNLRGLIFELIIVCGRRRRFKWQIGAGRVTSTVVRQSRFVTTRSWFVKWTVQWWRQHHGVVILFVVLILILRCFLAVVVSIVSAKILRKVTVKIYRLKKLGILFHLGETMCRPMCLWQLLLLYGSRCHTTSANRQRLFFIFEHVRPEHKILN